MTKVMYVVMHRGMPQFVSTIFELADTTAHELSVRGAPATVVPVTPIELQEQLELDFDDEPTNPGAPR